MKPLPGGDETAAGAGDLLDARGDDTGLEVDLLLGGVGVNLPEDNEGLLEAIVAQEVPRRLGEKVEKADLKDLGDQRVSQVPKRCRHARLREAQLRVRPCSAIREGRPGRPVRAKESARRLVQA